jgi:glutathione S-transferase
MACGLYDASNPECAYACDVTIEAFDDVMGQAGKALFAPEDKKAEVMEAFKAFMRNFLDVTNQRMVKNNWSFIAGNKLSVADFMVAHSYFTLMDPKFALKLNTEMFNDYVCVNKAMKRLEAPLADYLASRKFL